MVDGEDRHMILTQEGMNAAGPMPAIARRTLRVAMFGANPHPMVKAASQRVPIMNIFLEPYKSAMRPSGINKQPWMTENMDGQPTA